MRRIIAIDPGNIDSGYVILLADDAGTVQGIINKGKIRNRFLQDIVEAQDEPWELAIEMVACYGMPVGAEVFETCVWIGRFEYAAEHTGYMQRKRRIYRKDEKMNLCQSMKANDSTIRQALVDRFAYGQKNYGKGTKKAPGFFYGFSADAWQAMAVGVTYLDMERESRCAHHS